MLIFLIGIIAVQSAPKEAGPILLFSASLVLTAYAGIPVGSYLRLLKIPSAFLLMSILGVVVVFNSPDLLYSFRFFSMTAGVSKASLSLATLLFWRVAGSVSALYFLILTTPMNQILRLLKKIHLPNVLIELMILVYRSIFIFLEAFQHMREFQTLRFGYEGRKSGFLSLGLMVRSLFAHIFLKHREMSIALELKGYDGEFRLGD